MAALDKITLKQYNLISSCIFSAVFYSREINVTKRALSALPICKKQPIGKKDIGFIFKFI